MMGNYDFALDLNSDNTLSTMCGWIRDNTDVIEFGCANGRLTRYLAGRGCHMTIVEIDEKAGREAAPYAELAYIGPERGDVNQLCWEESGRNYDYVIFADVLEHLADPERILTESRKVLKPGGRILVSIPNVAHNSILIDLFLDRFYYDETGLLDRTHIHFFTYTTFTEMVQRVGLFIERQHPIYSSVGWNEIANRYTDVPEVCASCLRKRQTGSVYQYVFSLQESPPPDQSGWEEIMPLSQDLIRQQEISCYSLDPDAECGERKMGSLVYWPEYGRGQTLSLLLPTPVSLQTMRVDILEDSVLLQLHEAKVSLADGSRIQARVETDNALRKTGDWCLFQTMDPHIHLLWEETEKDICGVELEITIWDTGFEKEQAAVYGELLRTIQERYEQEQNAREWSEHLQRDIEQIQTEFVRYHQEASAYAKHLEADIRELQRQLREQVQQKEELQEQLREQLRQKEGLREQLQQEEGLREQLQQEEGLQEQPREQVQQGEQGEE